jgi:hypothetical protein
MCWRLDAQICDRKLALTTSKKVRHMMRLHFVSRWSSTISIFKIKIVWNFYVVQVVVWYHHCNSITLTSADAMSLWSCDHQYFHERYIWLRFTVAYAEMPLFLVHVINWKISISYQYIILQYCLVILSPNIDFFQIFIQDPYETTF